MALLDHIQYSMSAQMTGHSLSTVAVLLWMSPLWVVMVGDFSVNAKLIQVIAPTPNEVVGIVVVVVTVKSDPSVANFPKISTCINTYQYGMLLAVVSVWCFRRFGHDSVKTSSFECVLSL